MIKTFLCFVCEKVTVKLRFIRELKIKVHPKTLVSDLKKEIEELTKFGAATSSLIVDGFNLEPRETFAYYGVGPGSVCVLVREKVRIYDATSLGSRPL